MRRAMGATTDDPAEAPPSGRPLRVIHPGEVVEEQSSAGTASLTGTLSEIAASKAPVSEGTPSVRDAPGQSELPEDPQSEWRFSDDGEQE